MFPHLLLNAFDFATNLIFLIEMGLRAQGIESSGLVAMKAFRMVRIFKLAQEQSVS